MVAFAMGLLQLFLVLGVLCGASSGRTPGCWLSPPAQRRREAASNMQCVCARVRAHIYRNIYLSMYRKDAESTHQNQTLKVVQAAPHQAPTDD